MDWSTRTWNLLETINGIVAEPLLNDCKLIPILIIMNIGFSKLVYHFQKLTADSFFFPPLACFFGIFHMYMFCEWSMVHFITAIILVNGVGFEALLAMWKRRDGTDASIFFINYMSKAIALTVALLSLHHFRYSDDAEDFVIPLITMTAKLIDLADDIAQAKVRDELMKEEEIGAKVFFRVIGYLAFPGWISFRDFQSLPYKQHVKSARWRNMICSASARAALLNIVSYKYMDSNYFGDFLGRPIILYIIHGFQHRCRYYYFSQLAELEIISLGIKKGGWTKHYLFDFIGAETSVQLADFLRCFNIPLSSYARQGLAGDRTLEIFLIFGLGPFVILFGTNGYFATMWLLFFVSIFTQMSALGGLFSGTRTVLRLIHSHIPPNFAQRGDRKRIYISPLVRGCLIVLNQFRLAAMFNLNMEDFHVSLVFTMLGLFVDVSLIIQVLSRPVPQYVQKQEYGLSQPSRKKRRRSNRR